MKILHICNDLYGSKVHVNLLNRLSECGVEQCVFAPLRRDVSGFSLDISDRILLRKANVVKFYHRYLYHVKRRTVFAALCDEVSVKDYDMIHATNLFTDGGVAYLAHKKFLIPYIVAVRNTDVNGFLRLLPHTWLSGWRILLNAEKIVFISKALSEAFSKSWVIRPILPWVRHKFIVQPNGIEDYWIDCVNTEKFFGHRILYVGDFSRSKNVGRLIDAVV